MTEHRFDNRAVAVTGAGAGLGRAYATLFGRLGATVIVNDIGHSATETAAAIVDDGGQAVDVIGSVVDTRTSKMIIQTALEHSGRIDAIVNNAGIGLNRSFADTSGDDFERLLSVHFRGTLNLCQAAWPHMAERRYGRIVNIVSTNIYGMPGWTAYNAAKGAILGLSRSLALEGAPLGICVNLLAPGAATAMVLEAGIDAETARYIVETMPPESVAPAAAYLAHEACTSAGRTFIALGGRLAEMLVGQTRLITMVEPSTAAVAEWAADPGQRSSFVPVGSVTEALALDGS